MAKCILILLVFLSIVSAADEAAVVTGRHPYFTAAAKSLVTADGKKADQARILKHKPLLIYFSAHWCPPCRAFTPELVKYYADNGGGEKFEILFVSSDEDGSKMLGYMKEMAMPWVGLRFGSSKTAEIAKKYGGRGIPCLTVVDEKDEIIFHSYVDGTYVGPHEVLRQFTDLMKAEKK
jgi:nucleoredoxin